MASRTGYGALLTVGSYTGAELTEVTCTISHEPVDVSDLASVFRERQPGLLDWEVTGRANYATQYFLSLAKAGRTSVACKITDSKGSNQFSCVGFVTRGTLAMPAGAANQEITVVGGGATPSKPA